MSWLSKTFDSTKGTGISKKILVLFISGTLLPLLNSLGSPDWVVQGIGQLAGIYLGGQSLADAAFNWKSPKSKAE
jgi:hypothetical protein